VEMGANVNQVSPGDRTSPLVIATINGQFDVAKYLLDHGAESNLASEAGMTPLYAVLNVEWAPKAFYPQPRAYLQQQTSYLDLMQALLDKGADPNARVSRKIWYTQYNFDLLRVEEAGATPFWRAAYASDINAMKLLIAHGGDPEIRTTKPAQNDRLRQGGTRGDNQMIEYLVSKGADVKAVNRTGQTTVDMANGPVQRTQPYPETIKLLERLGATNNHKCVSC